MSVAEIRIENLVKYILGKLKDGELFQLCIPTIDNLDIIGLLEPEDDDERDAVRTLSLEFPVQAKRCAQLLAITALIQGLLIENRTISQRDVYYALKHLFKSQRESDTAIIDLGLLLGLKRYEMNVIPASRGYVAGNLFFKTPNMPHGIDCSHFTIDGGYPITSLWTTNSESSLVMQSNALFILVIEKEGIFRRLCEDRFHTLVPSILITGCGFPDIATRALVSKVSSRFPMIPVIGICDYNPFGLALLLTYKLGSKGMFFEGQEYHTDKLNWLGLRNQHVKNASLPDTSFETLSVYDTRKITTLTRVLQPQKELYYLETIFKSQLHLSDKIVEKNTSKD